MGSRKMGLLMMVIIFFTFLQMFELSSPLHHNFLFSESKQDIEPSKNGIRDVDYGRSGVVMKGSKFARGGVGGASGGGSTAQYGNNGGSGSDTHNPGGAETNHQPKTHHGTSSSNHNCIALATFIFTAFASLLYICTMITQS